MNSVLVLDLVVILSVGCIKARFFFHFKCIITLIENKFALPFNQNEIESSLLLTSRWALNDSLSF
jgi:hypothetical protein